MQQVLAEALLTKKILTAGTKVGTTYTTRGFAHVQLTRQGSYFIREVKRTKNGDLLFRLAHTGDGQEITTKVEDISSIDGMDPVAFANAYQLTATGEPLVSGRKRGRKSKNELIAIMLQEMLDTAVLSSSTALVARMTDDDEVQEEHPDRQTVTLRGILMDEVPPMLEVMTEQGESDWILPTQVEMIGEQRTAKLLDDFTRVRRAARVDRIKKATDG